MTNSMIKKDQHSRRSIRTPLRKGMESTFDFEATRIPQLKTKQRIGLQNKPEQTYDRSHIVSYVYWKKFLRDTRIPTYELPKFSRLCNQELGIQGKHNISPKLTIPTSSCIHPSTHNQETFGNRVPQPSKSIHYTSYGNTPELPPQYWVASRLSHQQLHKRDFRCRQSSGIPELQR